MKGQETDWRSRKQRALGPGEEPLNTVTDKVT